MLGEKMNDKQISKKEERIRSMQILYMIDLVEANQIEAETYIGKTDFIEKIVNGVLENISPIDDVINKNLTNYSLKRLSYIDKAIIRIATYELLYTELSPTIIINEAVELSKKFSTIDDFDSKSFNNKLLDNVRISLGK